MESHFEEQKILKENRPPNSEVHERFMKQEVSSPNQEEPLPTLQRSPPIRFDQGQFDEQMNAAQGSPATASDPPVASPTPPLPVASPAPPPPQLEPQAQAQASPGTRVSSRANKGKTLRYDNYIRSMKASYRDTSVLSIKDHPQNSEGRDITDIRPAVRLHSGEHGNAHL